MVICSNASQVQFKSSRTSADNLKTKNEYIKCERKNHHRDLCSHYQRHRYPRVSYLRRLLIVEVYFYYSKSVLGEPVCGILFQYSLFGCSASPLIKIFLNTCIICVFNLLNGRTGTADSFLQVAPVFLSLSLVERL